MKQSLIIVCAIYCSSILAQHNNSELPSSIRSDGMAPDPSAIFDVQATDKGMLIPRTDTSAVTSPARGLMIYQNSDDKFYYHNGAQWSEVGADQDSDPTNEIQSFNVSDYGDTLYLSDGGHILVPSISAMNRSSKDYLIGGAQGDNGISVQQTSDGGYIVLGSSESSYSGIINEDTNGGSDIIVVKMDNAGSITWLKLIGGINDETASMIQQTSDGGYIIAGNTKSSNSGDVTDIHNGGNWDIWIVKLDILGNVVWNNSLGGNGSDQANSIQQTTDSGYIISGSSDSSNDGDVTDSSNGGTDYWVIKLNNNGSVVWNNLLGGSGNDFAYSAKQTSGGGYIVAGNSTSSMSGDVMSASNGNEDAWVVKLNNNGGIDWNNLIGGSDIDYIQDCMQAPWGGYRIIGFSNSSNSGDISAISEGGFDLWVIELDVNGSMNWNNLWGGNSDETGFRFAGTSDGGYVVAGISFSSNSGDIIDTNQGGNGDAWVVKFDQFGGLSWNKLLGACDRDFFYSIDQTNDGGYIVTGYTDSSLDGDVTNKNHGDGDIWVVKLNTNGDIEN